MRTYADRGDRVVAGQKKNRDTDESAYNREIWRAIRRKNGFLHHADHDSGCQCSPGLRAACMDLRYSADQFYDRQGLYDISVVSTLGLTEKDVDALKALDGVADAVSVYSETTYESKRS